MESDQRSGSRLGRGTTQLRFGPTASVGPSNAKDKSRASTASGKTKATALATLKTYEAICISSVLEDCADQLAILGAIMPGSYESKRDAPAIVHDEIAQLVAEQTKLEDKYENLMNERAPNSAPAVGRQANTRMVQQVGRDLTNSANVMTRNIKQNPLTSDNLSKVQADRSFLEDVVIQTIHEMSDKNTFFTLIDAVKSEKLHKQQLQETIKKEEEGRKHIKNLKDQLMNVAKEKETEIQMRMEMIAHLKDQLQEMKAKTSMEKKYIKKVCMVSVNQTQKLCNMSEKELKDDIEKTRQKLDDEARCNAEITQYLRTHQANLEQQLEFWQNKYDKDLETKTRELEILKTSKAKDLEKLQELTKLYAEYEQVVVEDRIEKEKIRRKIEQEGIELKATIRLQSWWRGVMVRKQLGPFSKKKKKKKGGKKSGKKKKK